MRVLIFTLIFSFLGECLGLDLMSSYASETRPSLEADHQGDQTQNPPTGSLISTHPSIQNILKSPPEDPPSIWKNPLPSHFGVDPDTLTRKTEWSIQPLNMSLSQGHWQFALGFHEIPWGEAFRPPTSDISHPLCFRDSPLLDPFWVRPPRMTSAQAQFRVNQTTLQRVLTPQTWYPPRLIAPGSHSDLSHKFLGAEAPDQNTLHTPQGVDSELSGRISTLFDHGIDGEILYYKHFRRPPEATIHPPLSTRPQPGIAAALNPQTLPIQTIGQTLSYTSRDFVLRHDMAMNLEQPLKDEPEAIEQVDKGTQLVSVIGLDWSSQHDWSVGAQIQIEYDDSELIHRFLDWFSLRASYTLWEQKLILSLFFYKGINNPDAWFQPALTVHLTDSLSFSLRTDIVRGSDDPDQGYFWLVEDQSRIFAWIEAQF